MSARARGPRGARRPRDRRGAVLVLVAVLMVPLLALAAFSLDVGWWQVGANQLQTGADAAALAGGRALQLDTSTNRHARVHGYASQIAAANTAFAQTVTLAGSDVEARFWNPDVMALSNTTWPNANAVQVTARSTPGLILAGIALDSAPTIARRATVWIANINRLDCIVPWTLPYEALYDRIAALTPTIANATPPPAPGRRPDLVQAQAAALTVGGFDDAARTLVLRGPGTAAALPAAASGIAAYDGQWTGHGFGGAGSEPAVYAHVQGCDPATVSVSGDQGATFSDPGYECGVVRALSGLGSGGDCSAGWHVGAPAAPCHFRAPVVAGGVTTYDAGCYPTAAATARGVRRRVVWSDPTGGGADHRMVGTATITCAFRGLADGATGTIETCAAAGGAPIANLPRGTLAVTFHGLTTILRLGEESTDFGNVTSLDQRLLLVR